MTGSILDAIGNTPLVELSTASAGLNGRILAKLEYLNPGFSKKDRVAKQIIEDSARSGLLSPGQTVVELTSGNTGTGLAIVCRAKGHPFVAVMSKGNSIERACMMEALGAEIVLVDQLPGSEPGQVSGGDLKLVEREAVRLTKERSAFRADQFNHVSNFRAHFLLTGPEILRDAGKIDGFCDFVGTGGSFAGCTAAFKAHDPEIQCYVVEPTGAAVLAGKSVRNAVHPIQGGGYGIADLVFIDHEKVDGYIQISGEQSIQNMKRLARDEGIFAGPSSGANLAAARKLLEGPLDGATIAIIICDSGLKYLSTDVWAATPG